MSTRDLFLPGPEGRTLYGPNGWRLEPTEAGYAIVSPVEGPVAWAPFDTARERALAMMAA